MKESAEEIQARLDRGEWLTPGQVAELFGTTRSSVDRWIRAGVVGYRQTPSRRRECDPVDVRRELAEYRTRREGPDVDPATV